MGVQTIISQTSGLVAVSICLNSAEGQASGRVGPKNDNMCKNVKGQAHVYFVCSNRSLIVVCILVHSSG